MSKEVATQAEAVPTAVPDAVATIRAHRDLLAERLAAMPAPADRDPAEIAYEMGAAILAAETVDDILATTSKLPGLTDFIGQPLTFLAITPMESTFPGAASSKYLLCDVVTADGEPKKVTTGAARVCLQLVRLAECGYLPLTLVPTYLPRRTTNGYQVMTLVAAPSAQKAAR